MSKWSKLLKTIIYPHIVVVVFLTATSILGLIYSFSIKNAIPFLQYLSYIVSAYTLTIICFRLPKIINYFKSLKKENKHLQRWFSDVHLRINASLYGSLVWNVLFAVFQLVLGFIYKSLWFYSMFAYYVMLGVMRFFLLGHTRKYEANEETEIELKKYVVCGWLLLFMNLALAVIVAFIVSMNKIFVHHMITTIAIAAYTFFTLTFAIINLVRYKKYNSPVYSASKTISLTAAVVSMFTLETTMLTTFGGEETVLLSKILLPISGAVVIGFAITMAVIMIVKGSKKIKRKNKRIKKVETNHLNLFLCLLYYSPSFKYKIPRTCSPQ